MSPELVVDSPAALSEARAARFEAEARRVLTACGFFSVALPGGSVGTTFFPRLAGAAIDWSRTEFFWGDERAVPPSHPESNFGLARSLWLEPAGVPASRIHRMEAEAAEPEAAARAYADAMVPRLGAPARLRLVLLRGGPDGPVSPP